MLVAAYLVEAGLLLIVAPWTASWQHNYFGAVLPWLGAWMEHPAIRGGVTGVGLVTMVAGLRDLVAVFFGRLDKSPPTPERPSEPS